MEPIRSLAAVLAVLVTGLANPAAAATLALVGGGTFNVGETIEITLEGTLDGGEVEFAAFVELLSSAPSVVGFVEATEIALTSSGGADAWSLFQPSPCAAGSCIAVNQGNPGLISPLAVDPFSGGVSTLQLEALAPGLSILRINEDLQSGNAAEWFGAGGFDSIEINVVVPEPSTGAVLGFGLCWIAAGRRRARHWNSEAQR